MTRTDLLALGPEALAALANLGLVKRAQRELAAGARPELVIEADGTVIGTFADGVCPRLPPGVRLEAGSCSCKAAGVCRHRIAVVLAYVAAIPDATQKALAEVALHDTQTWQRSSPFLAAAAQALGLSAEQLDDLFATAALIEL